MPNLLLPLSGKGGSLHGPKHLAVQGRENDSMRRGHLLGNLESVYAPIFLFLSIFRLPFSFSLLSLLPALRLPSTPTEGEMEPFPATDGNLRDWADGKPKAHWSTAGPLRRLGGRGCNFPDLPVESALDQVHSQAGVSETPAGDRSRWPGGPPPGLLC